MKVVDRDTAAQTKHPCFVFAHSYILVRVLLDVEGKPKKYHNMFKGPPPPQKFCKVLPQIKRKAGDPQFENPNVQMESIQSK